MSWLTYVALCFIHALYSTFRFIRSYWQSFENAPQPLNTARQKLPAHLALMLVQDNGHSLESQRDIMVQNVERVTAWCRDVGIEKLTVFDREGILHNSFLDLRDRLQTSEDSSNSSTDSEPEYPLTPPLSDVSDSRTLTPETTSPPLHLHTIHISSLPPRKRRRESRNIGVLKRRKHTQSSSVKPTEDTRPITIHLISRKTGKPAVAKVAQHFLQVHSASKASPPEGIDVAYTIEDVEACLEGEQGFSPPDLMVVHSMPTAVEARPLELFGFPPWQMRLTEFYRTRSRRVDGDVDSGLLDEVEFRRALDQFSSAEMRLGK